jgi:hypothetical protein
MTVRRFLPAAALALVAAIAAPAFAEAPAATADGVRRPGQIAREGVDNLLRTFDQFVAAIPQYALPEVNAKGDIIIRRKNPQAPANLGQMSGDVTEI